MTTLSISIDITAANHQGNDESTQAHMDLLPHKSRLQQQVIDTFRQHGQLTCKDLERLSGLSHQTASARLSELKAAGVIKKTNVRRDRSAVLELVD